MLRYSFTKLPTLGCGIDALAQTLFNRAVPNRFFCARLRPWWLGVLAVWLALTARADFSLLMHNQFEYAFAPHAGEFNALPLTVSLWFQTTRADGALLNKYLSGSFNGYRVQIESGRLRAFYFRDRGSAVYGPALGLRGPLVNDGRWHHAAFVVDGRRGALYLDGALVDQLAWSGRAGPCSTTEPLRLGRYETSHTAGYDGALAAVSVSKAAWSAEQVQQCAQGSPTGTGPGLLGHWRFLEGAGESTADLSGHGHDLRLVRCGWSTNLPPLPATDGPQLHTLAASDVGGRSARLRALGVAKEPVVFFEVGLSTNLLVRRVAQIEPRTNGVFAASVLLEALEPGVTYLGRAVLSNASGLSAGNYISFTTRRTPILRTSGADFDRLLNSPPPPRSEGVAPRTVTLRGEVHPAGEETWAWFEWDDSDASLSTQRTVAVLVPANDQFNLIAATLTNLAPGKTFSARLVATNRHGSFASPPFAFQPRGGPGRALRFGASQLSRVATGPAIPTRGDFTVECWARADGPLTGWETMLSQNGEYQSELLLCLNPRVEPGWSGTNVAFTPGRWHHVAYVHDEFATLCVSSSMAKSWPRWPRTTAVRSTARSFSLAAAPRAIGDCPGPVKSTRCACGRPRAASRNCAPPGTARSPAPSRGCAPTGASMNRAALRIAI